MKRKIINDALCYLVIVACITMVVFAESRGVRNPVEATETAPACQDSCCQPQ